MATGARVYEHGIGFISSGSWIAATFSGEKWDYGGLHSTVSNTSRLTVPANSKGVYIVTGELTWPVNATGRRGLALRRNGNQYFAMNLQDAISATYGNALNISSLYELAVGDYVELMMWQDSGGSLTPVGADGYSIEFAAHLVELT